LFYYNVSHRAEMDEHDQDQDRTQPQCQPGNDSGDNWNELNELTLSVMANRTRYDRYKKTMANSTDAAVADIFCKEKAYYKERILAMTSGLFDERCENDDINRAHQEYIKSCIEYLKWNDVTEMVGEDTRSCVQVDVIATAKQELQKKIQETVIPDDDPAAEDSEDADSGVAVVAHQFQNDRIMSLANKMCIRKKTIDDFIVLKPSAGNTDKEINARLPKIRDYHSEIMKRAAAHADADAAD